MYQLSPKHNCTNILIQFLKKLWLVVFNLRYKYNPALWPFTVFSWNPLQIFIYLKKLFLFLFLVVREFDFSLLKGYCWKHMIPLAFIKWQKDFDRYWDWIFWFLYCLFSYPCSLLFFNGLHFHWYRLAHTLHHMVVF